MVILEHRMSVAGQHALQDMVELQMYIVTEVQQKPWPMLPRRNKGPHDVKTPHINPVGWSAAMELVDHGFIEPTSKRTFVVSKSGFQYYERQIKPLSA